MLCVRKSTQGFDGNNARFELCIKFEVFLIKKKNSYVIFTDFFALEELQIFSSKVFCLEIVHTNYILSR